LPFAYFFIIAYYLWKKNPFKKFQIHPTWAVGIFTAKVIAGTLLWAIYTYHYTERSTSDAFRFFDDAKIMHQALFEDPLSYAKMLFGFDVNDPALQKYIVRMFNWDKEYNYFLYNDSRTMLRFNTVCMLFSFGNYHVHTLVMSLFSMVGGIYLFKAFYPLLKDKKHLLVVAIFLIPSVIFYSSGVLKEGVLMAGIGFFFYALLNLKTGYKKPKFWILLLLGVLILSTMKIYVLLCLIPAMVYFTTARYILHKKPVLYFILFQLVVFLGLYLTSVILPDKDIFYMLYKKKDDFANVAMQYEAGSFIQTPDLMPTPLSFLSYIPFAIYTVVMRPYLWEAGSALVKFAAAENLLLLVGMLLPLFVLKKKNLEEKIMIYFLMSFVFYLYILIGFTTPVLGALSRYKVPALPFILIISLLLTDANKLKKITPFKNL
jgi:hypothetical protein